MFTGIIECVGVVSSLEMDEKNLNFEISSPISAFLKVDQSVSHNGVCLTVTRVTNHSHWVTAIDETLKKSNLRDIKENSEINLERCTKVNGRLDGHIVQGHVDTTAKVKNIIGEQGSWIFCFELRSEGLLVEKGSVCINGVSLTCFNIEGLHFSVAIIPYTYENTNFKNLTLQDVVNIEFDIVGKYIQSILNKR